MDDLQEEYKLASYRYFRKKSQDEEVGRNSQKDGQPSLEEESISQLVDLLKTEREQKVMPVAGDRLSQIHRYLY